MNKIIMYCDGACKDNQNYEISRGGFGALISYGDIQKELLGGEAPTTNNRMELNAIIQPLKLLKKPQEVIIFTDSMYVKKGMLEWRFNWVKRNWIKSDGEPVKNSELWKDIEYRKKYSEHHSNAYKERWTDAIFVNDGIKAKKIERADLEKYLDAGFQCGIPPRKKLPTQGAKS